MRIWTLKLEVKLYLGQELILVNIWSSDARMELSTISLDLEDDFTLGWGLGFNFRGSEGILVFPNKN